MRPSFASLKRATAALIPSSDVPDISPTTTPDFILALADRRRLVLRHASDHSAILREESLRFFPIHSLLLHDDCGLDALAGPLEQLRRLLARDTAHFHHDPLAPVDELVVGGAEIDHQIAVSLSEPDHRTGSDRIQHELCRCSRFHASRAGYHLG